MANKFSDTGDTLTYTVESNNTATTSVAVSGSAITITPVAIGTATITVTATDTARQTATQTLMVSVISALDTTKPTITLLGSATLSIALGTVYTDAGATASDDTDGNITASITTTITFNGNTVGAVNTNTAGVYSIAYNVSDMAGNQATPVTRTVTVMPAAVVTDTTPPTITLLGSATLSIALGTAYTDAGATASDDTDGNITASITTTITFAETGNTVGAVNTNTAGVYTIAYNVFDTTGNQATPVTRTVTVMPAAVVADTTKPTITLLGSATLSIALNTAYTDAGATASDDTDGNITASITTTITFAETGNTVGAVNTNTAGVYTIAYNVFDTTGNQATPVTRTVTVMPAAVVADTTKPTITLLGSATLSIALNTAYTDAGATASDDTDGNITDSITTTITFNGNTVSAVNTNTAGVYSIAYNVSDTAGNPATPVTRTVTVMAAVADTTPPTITLLGSATLSIALGTAYADAGATAMDNIDGNITASITTTITFAGTGNAVGAINTHTAGVYTIAYNVSDTAGNPATPVTRTVTVMPAAVVTDTTPTAKATESVTVSEKTIEVGGSSITVESRTIQVEVTTGVGEARTITRFSAEEVLKEVLETIANKAIATGGIDFTKAPPSIDSTITPTLVVNTAVDISVDGGGCPAKGCEVTLSYEASDEQAGKDLYVFHYDGAQWEALPHVRRDTINRKVTALATSFSPLALFNASRADKLAKQLNKDILPNLVQTMLASTMSAVSTRMDAAFSGRPQAASYQFDGQTVQLDSQTRLSANLHNTVEQKLPTYIKALKDDTLDWKRLIGNSSFVMPLNALDEDGGGAGATVWGSGEYINLSDKDWKGDVFNVQLGVDQRIKDDLLAGGLVSWSKGDVDYTLGRERGKYTHRVTSIHPYMARSRDGVNLWGSVGYGQGELSIAKKGTNTNGSID